jgi:hypothetical protein
MRGGAQGGADFPRIWNEILKGHPLVQGIPAQSPGNDDPELEIHLLGGQRLIFDAGGGFSLG